jgi:hypothetical protein
MNSEQVVNLRVKFVLFSIIILVFCITSYAQEIDSKMITNCLTLKMIAQKPAPKITEKPAPDVILMVPDDLHIRFELRNGCEQTIYYLADNIGDDKKSPAGFFLYRKKEDEWKSRFPEWRREGSLTDANWYHWLPLKTGKSVEFEYSDLSKIEGERSVAIYVNSCPVQEKRIEILAEPFSLKSPK